MIESLHPVLASEDLARSLEWFGRLGFATVFVDDPARPRYAAVRRDAAELHVQWAEVRPRARDTERPVVRVRVRDVDGLFAEFASAGVTAAREESPWAVPGDTPWHTREFHLRDPYGNGLQFFRPLGHPAGD